MENKKKYDEIFIEVLEISPVDLNENLDSTNCDNWDSIKKLSLVDELEKTFGIQFTNEEILNLQSYKNGVSFLKNHGIEM